MLRLPLILDVIASDGNEEDQEYLEDLGLSSIYEEPTFPVPFYHIDHIFEDVRSTEEQPLTIIFSGGEQYIVKHNLVDLVQMIAKLR